ncbi:SusC/RagA family TonB-linked outer membrane protein [Limibacterium fermenti]|uniref:SusC/RagA family TonB-linked outer membrane protein n=1 Tax=Limibacterium fermenti TaxID=3229863 RepID=UPI000E7FD57E|nr:SusC/RagA family TonB-linked outer membrane protein [Porphyromonadaceae bacterium]
MRIKKRFRYYHYLFVIGILFANFNFIFGQNSLLTGKVTDTSNEPLIGVNILQKGTHNGTITDIEGNFSINCPADAVLVFSYMGYQNQEVVRNGRSAVQMVLELDSKMLAEVVIKGAYGTVQKRSDMVGSAFQLNAKELEGLPANRIDNILEGRIPGLTVTPNSDDASSTKSRLFVRVRGEGSMSASNEPLWVVDGTPIYSGDRTNMIPGISTSISPLTYINPNDIESITVLKDATTTSIYGADGANGVILVTTKGGYAGERKVRLSHQTGISKINQSTRFKVLNAKDYLLLAKEAFVNSGRDLKYFPFQDNTSNSYSSANTDWSDVYYDTGYYSQTNLSIRGGTDKITYYVSGSYLDNKKTIIGNTQSRFSIRTNIDVKLSKDITFSLNNTSSYNVNDVFVPGNDYYEFLPIYTPYNEDGTMRLYNTSLQGYDNAGNPTWNRSIFRNSVAEREENDNNQKAYVTNTNAKLDYQILPGLKSVTQLGIDNQNINEETYNAKTNWSGMSSTASTGYSYRNNFNLLSWTAIQRFNYNRIFGKHLVGGILGFEARSSDSKTLGARGSGFINDKIKEVSYAVERKGSSGRSTSRSLSYFAQVAYSFDSRYYLTINARRDGNSGFGSDAQWGDFGSIGSSWNIHNEDFFSSDVINILKLKASFGSNGNSRIGSQEALGIYSYSESDNYMNELGGTMSGSPNKKLSWETAYMTNVGLRIGLFNKIDIDVDAYNKKTVNLLSNLDVSRTSGDTRSYRNSGEILNRGIEATIEARLIDTDKTFWSLSLNASHNKNKLLELYNGMEKVMGNNIWKEGTDLNTLYLVRWAGVDPRDGAPLWYDVKGNVTRTYNAANRVAWKSTSPIVTGGLTSDVIYGPFSTRISLSYVIGGYSFSSFGRNVMSDGLYIMSENQSVNQLDRWQNPGDVALSPKPIWGTSTKSVMNSTRHVYKTTNIKLTNVSISYSLPKSISQRIGATSCMAFVTGDNLLVWTPYDKKDRNSYKQSMIGYPLESTFSVGLDLSF